MKWRYQQAHERALIKQAGVMKRLYTLASEYVDRTPGTSLDALMKCLHRRGFKRKSL